MPFNKPPKPVGLGRIDAESPDPEGQIPWTGSSVEDFKAAGKKIGIVSKELMALLPALLDDEAKVDPISQAFAPTSFPSELFYFAFPSGYPRRSH